MSYLFDKIRDPVVRGFYRHQFLNAHRYKFGWTEVKTGRSRTGKTESNLVDCVILSKGKFDMNQVGWKPKEYVQVVEDAKPRSCIEWTEVGRGLSARKWQSFQNTLSGDLMQIMQIKKLILKMDVIDLGFLDSNVRKMIRVYMELTRPLDQPTYGRVFCISPNYRTGEIYYKHPIVKSEEGYVKLDKFSFSSRLEKLDPKLYDEFKQKEKSDKYMSIRKAKQQMEEVDSPEVEGMSIYQIANFVKEEGKEKFQKKGGSFDMNLIKLRFGIPKARAEEVKTILDAEQRTNIRQILEDAKKEPEITKEDKYK